MTCLLILGYLSEYSGVGLVFLVFLWTLVSRRYIWSSVIGGVIIYFLLLLITWCYIILLSL